jgi:hypothetical protein
VSRWPSEDLVSRTELKPSFELRSLIDESQSGFFCHDFEKGQCSIGRFCFVGCRVCAAERVRVGGAIPGIPVGDASPAAQQEGAGSRAGAKADHVGQFVEENNLTCKGRTGAARFLDSAFLESAAPGWEPESARFPFSLSSRSWTRRRFPARGAFHWAQFFPVAARFAAGATALPPVPPSNVFLKLARPYNFSELIPCYHS